jgi:hypothetical protein
MYHRQAIDNFIVVDRLLRAIKLQSRDFSVVTAYQITEKGLNFLARAPKEILMAVDDFLYRSGDILRLRFNSTEFEIYTASGLSQVSGVMDTEDVSYVSSPWLRSNLRYTSKPMRSMAHRAHESAATVSFFVEGRHELGNHALERLPACRRVDTIRSHESALAPNPTRFCVCARAMCVCARLSR